MRQTQQRAYHTTFVILIAIGAAVSWVTSYLLTRPLGTLSRASRELARGNLSYRAPVRSRDEVGQLASDFNRMAGQLEQNVNRIQESMALQERFMADFSHEMKTPMTSIIGYARPCCAVRCSRPTNRWTRQTISSPRASGSKRWG